VKVTPGNVKLEGRVVIVVVIVVVVTVVVVTAVVADGVSSMLLHWPALLPHAYKPTPPVATQSESVMSKSSAPL
jgi:hypothetical protein